jgi:hypothetical protein
MTTVAFEDGADADTEAVEASAPAYTAALVSLGMSVLGLAVLVVTLVRASPGDINGYGLAAAFHPLGLAALSAIIFTLIVSLQIPEIGARWLSAQVAVLVLALQLGPVLVEPLPRFATAWVHAGLAEYIARTGDVLPHTDARFSWPAFFAAAGFLAQAVGVEPLELLRWTPLLLGLLSLLPAAAIIRVFVVDDRKRVIALTLFAVGNWVGQDYFAPQGFNFLLFLVTMAALFHLLPWRQAETRIGRVVSAVLRRDASSIVLPAGAEGYGARVAALVVLVTLYAASAVSHQLTQFFTLFSLAALVLMGVCRLGWLVVLFAVITLGYFVWGAEDYWSGHLRDLTTDLGGLRGSIRSSVVSRTTIGTTPERATVVDVRLGLSAVVLLLAVVGLVRSRRRILAIPAVLAGVPALVMGLQSYGGEAALRVYLFSLVWLAILGAHAFGSPPVELRRRSLRGVALVATPLVCVAVATAFLLARYGNEDSEQMRPGDVAAADALYRIAAPGSSIFVLTESAPWRDHDIERYDYGYAQPIPLTREDLPSLLTAMRTAKGHAYLLVTDGEWSQMHFLYGVPAAQVAAAQQMYATAPELHRVYGSGTVGVYELAGASP